MKLTTRRAGAFGLGLALVVGAGGIASAETFDPSGWFSGGHATVADPDRTTVPLKIYNSTGTVITTGSTSQPVGAFIAADSAVRAGDTYASAFLVRPDAGSAPGAWASVQATGTTKTDGAAPVAALGGKTYVSTAGGYSIADFASGYSTSASTGDFANVYEVRLRSSSPSGGVSNAYASTFVKVSGSTWTVVAAPSTGGPTTTPTTPPTTPAPPAPPAPPAVVKVSPGKATIKVSKVPTGKKAGKATVTVKASAGRATPTGRVTVTLKKGGTSKKVSATLSGGRRAIKLPKLKKGSWKITITYTGDASYVGSTTKAGTLKVKK